MGHNTVPQLIPQPGANLAPGANPAEGLAVQQGMNVDMGVSPAVAGVEGVQAATAEVTGSRLGRIAREAGTLAVEAFRKGARVAKRIGTTALEAAPDALDALVVLNDKGTLKDLERRTQNMPPGRMRSAARVGILAAQGAASVRKNYKTYTTARA